MRILFDNYKISSHPCWPAPSYRWRLRQDRKFGQWGKRCSVPQPPGMAQRGVQVSRGPRRNGAAAFQSKVALAALKGDKALAGLERISKWCGPEFH
jgi:hypothetical protein